MTAHKLTKIVATIGPASESEAKMRELLEAGVNVFRFNTKHSTPDWHDQHIRQAQKIANNLGVTIGILLDLQGPEVRLETREGKDVEVVAGQLLKIAPSFVDGIDLVIPHIAIYSLMREGDELLIDDGFVETKVVKVESDSLIVEVQNDSVIKHRKGVNLPGKDIDFPSLIKRDIEQLDKNARNEIDFVGLSFVRSAHDIQILRAEMIKRGMTSMIVSKIESQPALDRLDEIIHESDVVMIARGDLGVEVPFEQLAYWQRVIIDKCRLEHKPVITATQMLESMIVNPRPTRAEVTDVAHAVFEGTDAVMLSGESASGRYPVKTVATMSKIAKWNENKGLVHALDFDEKDPTNTIAHAVQIAVSASTSNKIDAVVVFTETGYTARAIAKYRLPLPVYAVSDQKKTAESLTVSFGVTPVVAKLPQAADPSPSDTLKELKKRGIIEIGQTIVVVHGQHWHKPGTTNSLSIITL